MNDLATLEILASINRLTSEVRSFNPQVEVPWYKTYITLISGVIGITLAFLYNLIKDYVGGWRRRKTYKKCILEEMDIINDNMKDYIPLGCKMLDNIFKDKTLGVYSHSPEVTSVCYESFFPESILNFTSYERKKVMQLYSKVNEVNVHHTYLKNKFLKSIEKTDTLEVAFFFLTACVACFILLKEIKDGDDKNSKYDFDYVIKELGIKSEYIEKIRKEAASQ